MTNRIISAFEDSCDNGVIDVSQLRDKLAELEKAQPLTDLPMALLNILLDLISNQEDDEISSKNIKVIKTLTTELKTTDAMGRNILHIAAGFIYNDLKGHLPLSSCSVSTQEKFLFNKTDDIKHLLSVLEVANIKHLITAKDNNGNTPLHILFSINEENFRIPISQYIIKNSQQETVKEFYMQLATMFKAQVRTALSIKNNEGDTPLHVAVKEDMKSKPSLDKPQLMPNPEGENVSLSLCMLAHSQDRNILLATKNSDDKTPLELAASWSILKKRLSIYDLVDKTEAPGLGMLEYKDLMELFMLYSIFIYQNPTAIDLKILKVFINSARDHGKIEEGYPVAVAMIYSLLENSILKQVNFTEEGRVIKHAATVCHFYVDTAYPKYVNTMLVLLKSQPEADVNDILFMTLKRSAEFNERDRTYAPKESVLKILVTAGAKLTVEQKEKLDKFSSNSSYPGTMKLYEDVVAKVKEEKEKEEKKEDEEDYVFVEKTSLTYAYNEETSDARGGEQGARAGAGAGAGVASTRTDTHRPD